MVDVLWDGKIVTMFAVDVNIRGTEIWTKARGPKRKGSRGVGPQHHHGN